MLIYKFDKELVPAIFLRRLNKFLIEVELNGKVTLCHLHDPGRLEEILKKGRKLLLIQKEGNRKTKYDVIAAFMEDWVLIHSGYHSLLAENLLKNNLIKDLTGYKIEKREFKYGSSRIDFLLSGNKKCLLEVKGCTLAKDGIAMFPDAPTARGRRHIMELMDAMGKGYEAAMLFLIMRNAYTFSPNWDIDRDFSLTLKKAYEKGIKIIACRIKFKEKQVYYAGEIPVIMEMNIDL
ncbi:MAG: DNA/RNA nuclease SfsA [Thermoplasmata archaeon]|nr:MAG: DNA/RNA nuclease SfsA [Thermoplasmata archaeon]